MSYLKMLKKSQNFKELDLMEVAEILDNIDEEFKIYKNQRFSKNRPLNERLKDLDELKILKEELENRKFWLRNYFDEKFLEEKRKQDESNKEFLRNLKKLKFAWSR